MTDKNLGTEMRPPLTGVIVRSGWRFDVVCSRCGKKLLKDLPNERATYLNAGIIFDTPERNLKGQSKYLMSDQKAGPE
jgi:hypothetical protein